MHKIKMTCDEKELESLIKDFLSLSNGSIWSRNTILSSLKIKFTGNEYKVQKAIYEWLSVPPRKQAFEQLGGK